MKWYRDLPPELRVDLEENEIVYLPHVILLKYPLDPINELQ
jgi:hypothetical protein